MGNDENFEENNYVKEMNIKGQPKPLSIRELDIIKKQMENVFVINLFDEKGYETGTGTGFFCKIPFPDEYHLLPVLITNNHIINDMKRNLLISYNNSNIIIDMIEFKRRCYTEKDHYDITIIEMLSKDNINLNSFLEIDIQTKIEENKIIKNDIYILHYPKGNEISISPGKIEYIKNNTIFHNCSTDQGSSGSPIFNKSNFKILGVHKGHNKNYNLGSLIGKPIEEFIKKNYVENINNIAGLFNDSYDIYNIIDNPKNKAKILNNNFIDNNNNNDEIIIQYKINNSIISNIFGNDIKIFGQIFVDNNKEKCKIIINEKEEELKSIIKSKDIIRKDNNILTIKLKGINNITDISYMFEGCNSLLNIFGIKNWNTSKVVNMRYMLADCNDNKYLPEEISFLNTENVRDLNGIFSNCNNLESVPDISKWKTDKVEDMSNMFYKCSQLKSLPDISKWITCNVKNMESMFCECEALLSLPDISKWDVSNVLSLNCMFYDCQNLKEIPDISKWKPEKLQNKSEMFLMCISLKSKPNISKWNIYNSNFEKEEKDWQESQEEEYYRGLLKSALCDTSF